VFCANRSRLKEVSLVCTARLVAHLLEILYDRASYASFSDPTGGFSLGIPHGTTHLGTHAVSGQAGKEISQEARLRNQQTRLETCLFCDVCMKWGNARQSCWHQSVMVYHNIPKVARHGHPCRVANLSTNEHVRGNKNVLWDESFGAVSGSHTKHYLNPSNPIICFGYQMASLGGTRWHWGD